MSVIHNLVLRVAMGFGLGGMFGSIFWKLGLSESSISGRISLYVNVAMNVAMLGCIRALQTLAVETRVVNLERMDEVKGKDECRSALPASIFVVLLNGKGVVSPRHFGMGT